MANFFLDNNDLQFYIDKGIDWETLYEVTEYGEEKEFENWQEAVQFYKDMLELLGDFSANEIAPRAPALDREHPEVIDGEVPDGPAMKSISDKAREIELHRLPLPREFGGMNAPMLVNMINGELLARGDVSVMTHFGFHAGIAMALMFYSIHEGSAKLDFESLKVVDTPYRAAIEEMSSGEAWGSMDITEAQAGSDMAAIRCKGEQDAKGNWFVTGEKIFITSGHGKYHIVIARTEDSADMPGLQGLSLFLVEAYENGPDGTRIRSHTTVSRVEEKIGHNGSATAVVNYEKSPATLLGQRGEGFKLMLLIMNNARVGVGFESLGLCENARRLAKDYAAERPSMEKMIDQHEMIADMLDEMESDCVGIRAMAITCAFNEEMSQRYKIKALSLEDGSKERKEVEHESRKRAEQSRLYTPLLKYFAAEKAVEMGRRSMQILGGAGYTTEYGAEKLLRDSLVLPIYEGTSQIQSLMATKDNLLWIMKNPKEFGTRYAKAVQESLTERDPNLRNLALLRKRVYSVQRHLMGKIISAKLKKTVQFKPAEWKNQLKDWDQRKDFAPALLHAERMTKMLVDVAICDILAKQAAEHPERQEWFERSVERALPRSRALYNEITTTGDRLLAKLAANLAES